MFLQFLLDCKSALRTLSELFWMHFKIKKWHWYFIICKKRLRQFYFQVSLFMKLFNPIWDPQPLTLIKHKIIFFSNFGINFVHKPFMWCIHSTYFFFCTQHPHHIIFLFPCNLKERKHVIGLLVYYCNFPTPTPRIGSRTLDMKYHHHERKSDHEILVGRGKGIAGVK